MLLEGRDGPNLSDRTFDGSLQGAGLVVSVADDEYFLRVKHCANAHGECSLGHLVHVALEEAAVCDNRIGGEALLTGAALEAGERLVESEENDVICGISSGICFATTLIPIIGIQYESGRLGTNIRMFSALFFIVFAISHFSYAGFGVKMPYYIIVNGIMLMIYLAIFYKMQSIKDI